MDEFTRWLMLLSKVPYMGKEEIARKAFCAGQMAERERICAAIKAEDDHCADGDYMMDSDDCIKVALDTWERPDWNGSNA